MLIKIVNSTITYPYDFEQLEQDNPGMSIGRDQSDQNLAEFGVFRVLPTDAPTYDPLIEQLTENTPILVDGQWHQRWAITAFDRELVVTNIRQKRNRLLQESDWTQLSDSPVDKAKWAEYRQALRNLSQQQGYPYSVIWPTKPNE